MRVDAFVIIPHSKNKGTEVELEIQPLVLCKDCKYWDEDEHNCNIKIGWFACGPAWFCADGRSRDED